MIRPRSAWMIAALLISLACLVGPLAAPPAPMLPASATPPAAPTATITTTPTLPASPTAARAPSATAPPTGTPSPTPEPAISLMAVGDLMLARQLGDRLAAGEVDYPFSLVAETLRSADITVGNLECAISDGGAPLPKSYRFRAPPPAAEALARAGFDLVTLANNHSMDYGPDALSDTLGLLEAAGVAHIGAGRDAAAARAPGVLERNGLRVAFLGYVDVPVERSGWDARSVVAGDDSPGLAWADLAQIAVDVAAARQQADIVVVLAHSGYEYHERPNPIQIAIGRAAVDSGAALVIMAHSHTLQGVEYYNGGVIAYSLGNFAFEIERSRDSAILNVTLSRQGVQRFEWIPVTLDPNDGRPSPAEGAARERILENINRLTVELE